MCSQAWIPQRRTYGPSNNWLVPFMNYQQPWIA
ncbi:hypothetical protein LINPERPRIM_LOCUS38056 [Linum perenne]